MRYEQFKRWLYQGNRPNGIARVLNAFWGRVHALGIAPGDWVTLEVPGRRSGRIIRLPLVIAVVGGERYLVSMLGDHAAWVRNVQAAGGNVTLRHGRSEQVRLEAVAPEQRAPVLQAYLKRAPGARAHLPVDWHAPLIEFERVAVHVPVFRIVPRSRV